METDDDTKPVYFSPHRVPLPASVEGSFLIDSSGDGYLESLSKPSLSTSPNAGGSNYTRLPSDLRIGTQSSVARSRSSPDAAPYFKLKERIAYLEFQKGQLLSNIHDELGEVPSGYFPDVMESFENAVDRILPGLEFEGVSNEGGEYKIRFEGRDGQSVNYDQLSSGERDVIAIIFSLIDGEIESRLSEVGGQSPDESDIAIIIDGPESYLHPKLQRELLYFLREFANSNPVSGRNAQVIICTHSPTILDSASSDELFFMVFPDQCDDNQLRRAEDIDIGLMRSLIGGPGTSSLSTGTPLLLVEGDTDYDVLIQLFDDFEDNITVQPIYGKGKITRLSAAFDDLVPQLQSNGIEIFALVDWDLENPNKYRDRDRIHQTPGYCMENLLLNPSAIYDALQGAPGPSELRQHDLTSSDAIDEKMHEIISSDDFTQREIDQRLRDRLRSRIVVDDLSSIDENTVRSRIESIANKKKDRPVDIIDEVQHEVSDAVESESLDDLNGKLILQRLVEPFDISADDLARMTAKELSSMNEQPEFLISLKKEIESADSS